MIIVPEEIEWQAVGQVAIEEVGRAVRIMVPNSMEAREIVENSMLRRVEDIEYRKAFLSHLRG